MEAFLFKANKNVLDISYSVNKNKLIIQVVLLEGQTLSIEMKENLKNSLTDFDIIIKELHLTKNQFNENKGEWQPQYYNWLNNLLLTKAEVI